MRCLGLAWMTDLSMCAFRPRAKRAELAGEIILLKRKLAWAEDNLRHLDASLLIFDLAGDPAQVPAKRPQKRVKLFRQGKLGGLILGALWRAKAPMSTAAIVDALVQVGSYGDEARPGLVARVRGNLAYLARSKRVEKIGRRRTTKWIAPRISNVENVPTNPNLAIRAVRR